ncbi:MAG: hypothetical protein M3O32_00745 [Actinomycetota bacterium]|nr:hypothetical protein [Actinomycetota bacterium]
MTRLYALVPDGDPDPTSTFAAFANRMYHRLCEVLWLVVLSARLAVTAIVAIVAIVVTVKWGWAAVHGEPVPRAPVDVPYPKYTVPGGGLALAGVLGRHRAAALVQQLRSKPPPDAIATPPHGLTSRATSDDEQGDSAP